MPADFERRAVAREESDFFYTDKTSDRRRGFRPSSREAVVTFGERPSETRLGELLAATPFDVSAGVNLERGFAAVETDDDALESRIASATDAPEIVNAIPAMIDDDGLTRHFLPDELTVQFVPGVDQVRAESIIARLGSRVIREQRTPGYYTIAVPEGRGLFATIRDFTELDEVAFAEPSEVSFNSAVVEVPDDPDFGLLWGLHNTGQTVDKVAGTPGCDIDALQAWDLGFGDPDVIVAVIDTGADLDHPDLQANILPRGSEDWDFADAGDPSPDDTQGHGSHVSGTIAAPDDRAGLIGVAPRCRVMPLRVDLTSGMNQNRADALNYVAAQAAGNPNRRYVVNCSWVMNGDHAGVRNAIVNAVNNNVVVVYAAGNDGRDIDVLPRFPAVYPEVIAVAATDQNDVRAGFSNIGRAVDVAAPGVNIHSASLDGLHAVLDGTSMASPHVAGLAALLWSHDRDLTNAQVRAAIETTCENVDAANPAIAGLLGRGRVNAFQALASLLPLSWAGTGVSVFGRALTRNLKTIFHVTAEGRLAQTWDHDGWHTDFPAELAGEPDLRFQGAPAVFARDLARNLKTSYAITTDGRLAQIWDHDGWKIDFPAELAGAAGLRFAGSPVVFARDAERNLKTLYAITTDGRLAQIWDHDGWHVDFPAEVAGHTGLRFQNSPAVFARSAARNLKTIYAVTREGRLAQVWDHQGWNLDFPAELAGSQELRFQGSPTVFARDPGRNLKTVYAVTSEGRLAQVWDHEGWNIDFPAELAGAGELRFGGSPTVFVRSPRQNLKTVYAVTSEGRLAQIWDHEGWNIDFPAELAGFDDLRFKGAPAGFGRDMGRNLKSLYAVTADGRLAQIWDHHGWNLDFPG
ncbi:S8 family peptidase [Spirillospora sp. CA-294931]|uniref:S8 family peptidase n=1 Tax=Spirillospora sp. CA-294931 TaxID=3240042 RepID=UPI003D8D3306